MCHPDSVLPSNKVSKLKLDEPNHLESAQTQTSKTRRLQNGHGWVLFRLGKLRFGAHGLMGISSLFCTIWTLKALENNNENELQISLISLVLVTQALLTCLTTHATTLLAQVPPFTAIIPGLIVAPHKEAFQRTISIMLYLVCRILLQVLEQTIGSTTIQDNNTLWMLVSGGLLFWRYWPLVPAFRTPAAAPTPTATSSNNKKGHPSSQWTNGNTWIFVVPMFIATTLDLSQLFLGSRGDLMTTSDLVDVQLTGLLLAFGFSLGFRGYISMPLIYFGAAMAVFRIMRLQIQKL